jgi:hypothetical protein
MVPTAGNFMLVLEVGAGQDIVKQDVKKKDTSFARPIASLAIPSSIGKVYMHNKCEFNSLKKRPLHPLPPGSSHV